MYAKQNQYFEKQSMFNLNCGLHTLNNLLGQPTFDKERLDNICYSLSKDFINPHKNILGGEYDINVLIVALQQIGCNVVWHDKRKPFVISQLKIDEILGYLLNIQQQKSFWKRLLAIEPRHWIAVKKINSKQFCVLDSKKEDTINFTTESFIAFVNQCIEKGSEVLCISLKHYCDISNGFCAHSTDAQSAKVEKFQFGYQSLSEEPVMRS